MHYCIECAGRDGVIIHAGSFFVLATGAQEEDVEIALAGDAVVLIKDAVINSVVPVGWPPLKDTFPKVVQHGIPIHV